MTAHFRPEMVLFNNSYRRYRYLAAVRFACQSCGIEGRAAGRIVGRCRWRERSATYARTLVVRPRSPVPRSRSGARPAVRRPPQSVRGRAPAVSQRPS